jgi:hypothetical protein
MTVPTQQLVTLLTSIINKELETAIGWEAGMAEQYVPGIVTRVIADLDAQGYDLVKRSPPVKPKTKAPKKA